LSTGEQLYVLDDNKFVCKDNKGCKDFMMNKGYHIGEYQSNPTPGHDTSSSDMHV
jgi:hypothetical protein